MTEQFDLKSSDGLDGFAQAEGDCAARDWEPPGSERGSESGSESGSERGSAMENRAGGAIALANSPRRPQEIGR